LDTIARGSKRGGAVHDSPRDENAVVGSQGGDHGSGVYCGNCIAVCPTGALVGRTEFDLRQAARWNAAEQTRTDTVCPYCGVGCVLTVHVQDNRIVKVTSPFDHDVTRGNLCVKGRFGWAYVHATGAGTSADLVRSVSDPTTADHPPDR
jgi:predicted molibdopterin-dependent oxidoreductase YjgC